MKIDTTTLLLIGAAAVGVYLLTRPRPMATTPVYTTNPYAVNPYAVNPYAATPTNATAQDIAAGGSALSSLATAVSNFF